MLRIKWCPERHPDKQFIAIDADGNIVGEFNSFIAIALERSGFARFDSAIDVPILDKWTLSDRVHSC